ncbi:MAG TPA: MtrB/PioB family outer membrane beta-barrel protein, partial [Azospira sp.]|nr:MtrB/PioB family outer membrane beta-barrel protein [Azospira sp.]
MKKQKNVFRVSALASAVLGAFAANTYAADDEVAQLIKPDSSISVGVGNQNNDRMRLGIYDGQQDKGAYGLVDADIKLRDDATGTWNELRLNNLGLDNREVFVSHSRQGDYGASFEYSRIPRESHYTVNTKLQYGDRGNNTIQETVPAVFTPGTGYNLRLGTVRDRYTLSIDKLLGGAFEFNAKYRQEEKQGRRFFSAYNGSVTQFLFEPIDTVTRQLDLMGSYLGKNLQLQAGYYGSWFRNDDSLIRFTSTSAATTNYVSLPPDNQAHQFYLNGAYTFTPTTKANFRMARTVASQDDRSLLSAIPAAGGSVSPSFHGVNAKVVTTEYQMGLSSNPIKNLSLTANLHYHDRDDQTPYV